MANVGTSLELRLRKAACDGDKLADDTVEAFVRTVSPDDLLDYLQNISRLPTRRHLGQDWITLGESKSSLDEFEKFLAEMSKPPDWISPQRVEMGAAFFRQRVSAAAVALGTASLPTCYCWEPEAGVLMYTERFALETPRRILETAQFVLDVMSPKGLTLGQRDFARGVRAVQKIRLMHAVIRYILRNRDALLKRAKSLYEVETDEALEEKAKEKRNPWIGFLLHAQPKVALNHAQPGIALNQEQLAGTVLTFSLVILQSFKRIHMCVSRKEEEAYLHAWKVVGYLLGVDEDLLEYTGNYRSAEELRMAIMDRHRKPSMNAQTLTAALTKYLAEDIELLLGLHRWLPVHRIPKLTMWMLLERRTLEACGVVLDRLDRWLLYPLVRCVAIVLGFLHNIPLIRQLSIVLFDYLSKNVWAWRKVPFGGDRAEVPPQAVQPVENWSRTAETRPIEVAHPSSTLEIQQVINEKKFPSPVQVMGSYHSTASCVAADGGTIIRFDHLKRVLEIGPNFVEAEAGALYVDVAHELYRRGLEFYVNLQIGNITMGAAACTTTKDGSFPGEWAQASSYCTAMTIVRPDGMVKRIEDKENDEAARAEMRAARSSHGLLGVVCSVRFKVRPIQHISIEHRNMSVAQFLKELKELVAAQNCSVEYYLYPFIDRVSLKIRRKSAAKGNVNRRVWKIRNFTISRVIPIAARVIGVLPLRIVRAAVSAIFYRVASFLLRLLCNAEKTYAFDQMTRYPDPPGKYAFTFSMWAFPEKTFYAGILNEYIAFLKDHDKQTGYRSHMPTVGYVVSQDANALLSYSWSGRVITIDPTGIGGAGWDRFLDAFNQFSSSKGGTPLFNQTPRLNPNHMRAFSDGDRLQQFKVLRKSIDGGNRHLNEYFAKLLQDGPADS